MMSGCGHSGMINTAQKFTNIENRDIETFFISIADLNATCRDFFHFLMPFFINFQFWRPAGLQVPLEVDFRSQKRQKSHQFWTLNSTFPGSVFHSTFRLNSSSDLGTF